MHHYCLFWVSYDCICCHFCHLQTGVCGGGSIAHAPVFLTTFDWEKVKCPEKPPQLFFLLSDWFPLLGSSLTRCKKMSIKLSFYSFSQHVAGLVMVAWFLLSPFIIFLPKKSVVMSGFLWWEVYYLNLFSTWQTFLTSVNNICVPDIIQTVCNNQLAADDVVFTPTSFS